MTNEEKLELLEKHGFYPQKFARLEGYLERDNYYTFEYLEAYDDEFKTWNWCCMVSLGYREEDLLKEFNETLTWEELVSELGEL